MTAPGTGVPLEEGNADDRRMFIAGPVIRLREGLESAPAETTLPTLTPYQLGLAARGVSWADLNMREPTPYDPFECGWIWWELPERPDREPEM